MDQENQKLAIPNDRPVWDGLPWKFMEQTSSDSIGTVTNKLEAERSPTLAEYAVAAGRVSAEIDAMRVNAGVSVDGVIGSANVVQLFPANSTGASEETNHKEAA